jgi:hypothetical protein
VGATLRGCFKQPLLSQKIPVAAGIFISGFGSDTCIKRHDIVIVVR